ncbi:pyridoxamine 5'-phosphate oxidase family protein [Campylobacter sp. RM12920]|uniref:Pyridoxamine 5'-phosphate oxidase family protein n=1 Tax=Campylobacter californiensis TaxID=1032243 RepID=A0ABD4JJW5_9BACT|nr:pyridoxamine 5'-phosphate oxidase family protein [Campylobacter sp. RM12919]MBE2988960.1 pyridoxamine 5'-phosphate oxidase family protein [Campylobacter sp. RM12920]
MHAQINEKPLDKIQDSVFKFVDSLKTVIISSLNSKGQCVSSYAPFVREGDEIYLCLSSIAEHYSSLKASPNKASLLFLEDESTAKTILARVRLSIKCEVDFIKDEAKRDEYFDKLVAKNPNESAFVYIKNMKDFYVVKASLKQGRFVRGFGAAYDTLGLKVIKGLQEMYPHESR